MFTRKLPLLFAAVSLAFVPACDDKKEGDKKDAKADNKDGDKKAEAKEEAKEEEADGGW